MGKIKIGIVGFGNLGKGVELAITKCSDMELAAIFTRRNPDSIHSQAGNTAIFHLDKAVEYTNAIDVMILCGGSATDLPVQSPLLARHFNIVDSFDTHAKIPAHYRAVNSAAQAHRKTAAICIGWDPGLFSLNRMMAEGILPEGTDYTFWGPGVSQGHSDAIRRVPGVKAGVQYTIPIDATVNKVRAGFNPSLTTKEKHRRDCYVVAEDGADEAAIAREIKSMPDYFADYDTSVTFISAQELKEKHAGMPHGGFVIRSGLTGSRQNAEKQIIEFSLRLQSNPQFTASVLVAYARAVHRLYKEGHFGAKTIFDIPPSYITTRSGAELLKDFL